MFILGRMQERRRIFTSFHDLAPREYMYFPSATLEAGKPGSFSRTELVHLAIAMTVLTVAFSFAFSPLYNFDVHQLLQAVPVSFIGIVTAFFVHEISHKFMAQKFGLWSEFRMYPFGLLISLLLGMVIGFVFAAPGAVMFRGETRSFEMGKIAAAGPSANVLTAAVTYPLSIVLFETTIGSFNIGEIVMFVGLINSLLATFNLLPFGPLDGVKVIRWNGIVWSVLFASAVVLLALNIQRGVVFPGL